jgi:hypothetical protein
MAVSSDANAAAYAYSAINITGFLATTTTTGGVTHAGAGNGFDTFDFTSTKLTSSLDSTAISTSDAGIVGTTVGTAQTTSGPVPVTVQSNGNAATGSVDASDSTIDLQQLCLGDCGSFTNNNNYTAPAFNNLVNFAVSDSHMTDTVLNGDNTGNNGVGFGVQAGTSVNGHGHEAGVANSASTNLMNWNFVAGADDAHLNLSWTELRSLFLQKEFANEFATATLNFKIVLQDDTAGTEQTLFDLVNDGGNSPSLLNLSPTLVEGGSNLAATTFPANDTAVRTEQTGTGDLVGGHSYNLVFTFLASSEVRSPSVPEPGALGLLGVGLIGLGALQYRRKQKKASA